MNQERMNARCERELEKLITDPSVDVKRIKATKYRVIHNGITWHLNPLSRKCIKAEEGKEVGDLYFLDGKTFYAIHIAKSLNLGNNFGKQWSSDEDALLWEMFEADETLRAMAEALEREPLSVLNRFFYVHDLDGFSKSSLEGNAYVFDVGLLTLSTAEAESQDAIAS